MTVPAWSGPLGDALALVIDHRGKTPKKLGGDWTESGVPVLSAMHVKGGRVDAAEARCISEEMHERWMPERLCAGDVLLTSEAPLGEAAYLRHEIGACLGQRLYGLRADEEVLHSRFLYFLLRDPTMQAKLAAHATGTTVLGIRQSALVKVEVDLPDVQYQRQVASVLGSYDDLIENNRRRIEILEEMAGLVYREWFVHFRFPGHGDIELVDSELGTIPEGWVVSSLESLQATAPNATAAGPFGSKLGRKDYVECPGVPVIRGANLRLGGGFVDDGFVYVSDQKAETLSSSFARPGDVVVTQRGTLGQIALIPESSRFDAYVLSQSQMKFTASPELVDPLVIYMHLATPEGTRRIQDIATGSGVPHINLTMFREMKFLVPPRSLQAKFVATVGPMERLNTLLGRQNRTLMEARDLLLPPLISGELDVSALDLDLEPVA